VQELTDSSFEHLTQAASGATTGDWLVMFFTSSCQLCHRLMATLESVGCKHRGRINVARVNKETYGEKSGRRFELGLEDKPDII
jgi:thioredoxin-like negative regulator of GroEL